MIATIFKVIGSTIMFDCDRSQWQKTNMSPSAESDFQAMLRLGHEASVYCIPVYCGHRIPEGPPDSLDRSGFSFQHIVELEAAPVVDRLLQAFSFQRHE